MKPNLSVRPPGGNVDLNMESPPSRHLPSQITTSLNKARHDRHSESLSVSRVTRRRMRARSLFHSHRSTAPKKKKKKASPQRHVELFCPSSGELMSVQKPTRFPAQKSPSMTLTLKLDLKNKSSAPAHSLIKEAHRRLSTPNTPHTPQPQQTHTRTRKNHPCVHTNYSHIKEIKENDPAR